MDLLAVSVLLAALIVGVFLTETTIRSTDVGAAVVVGLFLLQETDVFEMGFTAGGFNVIPNDLLFAVLAAAATARLLRAQVLTTAQRLMIGLAAVVAWAVLQGVGDYGAASTLNESRRYLAFVAIVLYFSTMEPDRTLRERIGRMWVYAALGLCGLALLRWAANAAGLTGGFFGGGGTLRVLPSASALVIGQAAMMGVPALRERAVGLWKYLTPLMLVFVVLLQHRTVWVVVLVGLGYLLLRERALTPRLMASIAAGLVLFAAVSLTLFDDTDQAVSEQLADSATRTNTFEWRVAGWEALMRDLGPETLTETLLGQPPGGGWERRFDGLVVDVSPHNYYVETYLRLGVVGLLLTLSIYGMALAGRRWNEGADTSDATTPALLSHHALSTVIGVNLLYFITYSPDRMQAMLLGVGCAFLAGRDSTPAPRADRSSPTARNERLPISQRPLQRYAD